MPDATATSAALPNLSSELATVHADALALLNRIHTTAVVTGSAAHKALDALEAQLAAGVKILETTIGPKVLSDAERIEAAVTAEVLAQVPAIVGAVTAALIAAAKAGIPVAVTTAVTA